MRGSRAASMGLPTFHTSDTGEAGLSASLSGDGRELIRPGWASSSLALPTPSIPPGPHLTFQADGPSRPHHPSPIRHMRRLRQREKGREEKGRAGKGKAGEALPQQSSEGLGHVATRGKSGFLPASAGPRSHFPALSTE